MRSENSLIFGDYLGVIGILYPIRLSMHREMIIQTILQRRKTHTKMGRLL
jgi:hypothetical protein